MILSGDDRERVSVRDWEAGLEMRRREHRRSRDPDDLQGELIDRRQSATILDETALALRDGERPAEIDR